MPGIPVPEPMFGLQARCRWTRPTYCCCITAIPCRATESVIPTGLEVTLDILQDALTIRGTSRATFTMTVGNNTKLLNLRAE